MELDGWRLEGGGSRAMGGGVDNDERCLEGFDCDGDQTPARLSQAEGGPPVGLGGNIQKKKR